MTPPTLRISNHNLTIAGLVIATFCAIPARIVTGANLGLYICGFALAALIVAPLILATRARAHRLQIVVACCLPFAAVWMIGGPNGAWRASIALLAWTAAIAGLSSLVRTSAIAVIGAMLWLAWPVWLAPRLSSQQDGRLVRSLVAVHPIFAINGAPPKLGVWTQQPVMYRLTTLGQDLPYQLPSSIWPCVLVHALIGAGLLIRGTGASPMRPSDGSRARDASMPR